MGERGGWWPRAGGFAYAVALVLVGLWPTPVDAGARPGLAALVSWLHARGVPGWFDYGELEFTANIVYFVPLGLLASWRLRRWWAAALFGLGVSALIETSQLVFLPWRHPSGLDLLANSLGAAAGALLFSAANRRRRRLPAPLAERPNS